jgi:hypothetical protein
MVRAEDSVIQSCLRQSVSCTLLSVCAWRVSVSWQPYTPTAPPLSAVDGPAGSRKTALSNCLIHELRAQQVGLLAVAFIGITASLLLAGGRTLHSRFGLPLQMREESQSSIKIQSVAGVSCC